MAYKTSLAAVAAVALLQGVQAWNPELPPCLDTFRPFVYAGCFQDTPAGGEPTLDWRTNLDQNDMTIEKCMAECKGRFKNGLLSVSYS